MLDQHLYQSPAWTLQNTSDLTKDALLIFLQSGVEKFLECGRGIKPTPLDISQVPSTTQPW